MNCNRNDNDWNDKWWFAGVRNFLWINSFPTREGVYFPRCFCQPPSIFPASDIFATKSANILFSILFNSHATCKKNFRASSLTLVLCMMGAFCSLAANCAVSTSSHNSINSISIFSPKEYRVSLGICGIATCQDLYASVSFCNTGKLFECRGGGH